ncbi:hypothetical protein Tsp_05758, partial [Trichinella spiralis]|uniref:hypothetical protein n=1 Tax=Trichinella spiralis TaxID=6334 RepID=UPI0001EFBFB7
MEKLRTSVTKCMTLRLLYPFDITFDVISDRSADRLLVILLFYSFHEMQYRIVTRLSFLNSLQIVELLNFCRIDIFIFISMNITSSAEFLWCSFCSGQRDKSCSHHFVLNLASQASITSLTDLFSTSFRSGHRVWSCSHQFVLDVASQTSLWIRSSHEARTDANQCSPGVSIPFSTRPSVSLLITNTVEIVKYWYVAL